MSSRHPLLASLLAGRNGPREEAAILDLLTGMAGAELDEVMADVEAATLFRRVDDHRAGPRHHTALRTLLMGRLSDLGVAARANLSYGLQAGRTNAADEAAIRDIFRASQGEELTRLKNQLNMRTDAHDLEGLVFNDVGSADVRRDILAHIATEAASVRPDKAKVLADIDNTVVSAIYDRRFPRGTVYPGVLALFDALDQGPHDKPFSTGDLTFVTARPGDAFGLMKKRTRASLRRAGIATSTHVMTGGLLSVITHDLMAGRKVRNIRDYRALFPEYRIMFLGDSGQADMIVAESLRREYGDALDLALIHDVAGKPDAEKERLRGLEIHLVDTWIGGAALAHERGLISAAGLAKVATEAMRELEAVPWRSPDQERAARALFERDLALADGEV